LTGEEEKGWNFGLEIRQMGMERGVEILCPPKSVKMARNPAETEP
jgi:hypothetical protein